MLFSYVPFGVTVMVLGCPDYLHTPGITPVYATKLNLLGGSEGGEWLPFLHVYQSIY